MNAVTGLEEKLRGSFRYLAEGQPVGTLHGALLTSPLAHATIRRLDVSAARSLNGVHAVVTAADVPSDFVMGTAILDRPPLARGKIRFQGEPMAAVAAETQEIANAAIALIAFELEPLPIVSAPGDALNEGAAKLHDSGNLCSSFIYSRGKVDADFEECAHVIDHRLTPPRQVPAAMELEGGICIPSPTGIELRAATHSPFYTRSLIASMLGLPERDVRVIGSPIGGSYGGKEEIHIQPVLALLAWTARRPVRLILDRPQSMAFATTRHPFEIALKIGCDRAGRLLALAADVLVDNGAYASFGPEVLDTGMECIQSAYAFKSVSLRGRLAYTNNGVGGAFRGFGALQTLTAIELAVDILARKAGHNPLTFRRINLAGANDPGPLGQAIIPQPELPKVADALSALPDWHDAKASQRYLSGTGYALVRKGEGFAGGGPNGASGVLALTLDGQVTFQSSLVEMGQGLESTVRNILLASFDLGDADICCATGSTDAGADSGPTSASRGTQIALRLIRAGKMPFLEKLYVGAAEILQVPMDALRLGPGGFYQRMAPQNKPDLSLSDLAASAGEIVTQIVIPGIETMQAGANVHTLFTACAARARVRIDRWTGQVACTGLDLLPACGPPISPVAFQGQMTGAGAQALGFCLTEHQPYEEGMVMASNFDSYFIPTIADVPDIGVHPMTWLAPEDPVGIRGGGEIGLNAAAPAIANAVASALDAAPTHLPVRPEWVLDALARQGHTP